MSDTDKQPLADDRFYAVWDVTKQYDQCPDCETVAGTPDKFYAPWSPDSPTETVHAWTPESDKPEDDASNWLIQKMKAAGYKRVYRGDTRLTDGEEIRVEAWVPDKTLESDKPKKG